jgi:membrane protease subunit (stomatin/prohibitin family)
MTSILRTINQVGTPLSTLFFSDFNLKQIQNTIRTQFKQKTGIAIDYQNQNDVLALMRMVYINNSWDPHNDIHNQVVAMNKNVVNVAIQQIGTNVSQYIGYLNRISSPLNPEPRPISTSVYGNKM